MICELIIRNRTMIYCNHAYTLLEAPEFRRGQGVCLSDDGDNIDTGGEATHELDVHFPQAVTQKVSLTFSNTN